MPILPLPTDPENGLPVIVEYDPVPKRIPPIFIEFVVPSGSDMFVPIIVLLVPTPKGGPAQLAPALNPIKFEYAALDAEYPAPCPIKFEALALVASQPAAYPKKFELHAFIAPSPARPPKKFEKDALSACLPASAPKKFE